MSVQHKYDVIVIVCNFTSDIAIIFTQPVTRKVITALEQFEKDSGFRVRIHIDFSTTIDVPKIDQLMEVSNTVKELLENNDYHNIRMKYV